MSSQNEISPLQFKTEVEKIYNGQHPLKDFDFEHKSSEIEKVLEMAKNMIAPKPMIHGMHCSNCSHKMHCKSIKCPNCFKEQRKRKRQGLAIPAVPQPAAEVEPEDPHLHQLYLEQEELSKKNSGKNQTEATMAACAAIGNEIHQYQREVEAVREHIEDIDRQVEEQFEREEEERQRYWAQPKMKLLLDQMAKRDRELCRREDLTEEQRQMEDKEASDKEDTRRQKLAEERQKLAEERRKMPKEERRKLNLSHFFTNC